ncbi:MAG TPA: hypothetical protein PKE39_08640 [Ignavibacteria bacterium]|nr:hypothetical protein [Ignavibacteria bacterium]HMQ99077.1 hypothetical protein [Ignavibacteria bacterium]
MSKISMYNYIVSQTGVWETENWILHPLSQSALADQFVRRTPLEGKYNEDRNIYNALTQSMQSKVKWNY